MKTKAKYWTVDDIDLLQKLHADPDKTFQKIADIMGRNKNSVIGKLDRLNGYTARLRASNLKKRPYALTMPVLSPVEAPEGYTALVDIKNGLCRFPHPENNHFYCGAPCPINRTYCKEHHAICFVGTKRAPGSS